MKLNFKNKISIHESLPKFTNYFLKIFSLNTSYLQGKLENHCISINRLKNIFIDEAHCVSLRAGSFRSSYSKLGFLKTNFDVPVTALSGSATDHTVSIIKESLQMNTDPKVVKMSLKGTNLTVNFTWKTLKPVAQIAALVKQNLPDSCGIIYCSRRNTTKDVAHALKSQGISAVFIHGAQDDTEKCQNENKWKDGTANVACCTNGLQWELIKAMLDLFATLTCWNQ